MVIMVLRYLNSSAVVELYSNVDTSEKDRHKKILYKCPIYLKKRNAKIPKNLGILISKVHKSPFSIRSNNL